ncbi:uncharacterized protein RSE6_09767 [Rhynchosporium secalis]|uniref:Extracellular membrane protein CFEM domain-containing protein n=1 Tax=Rhynchosporium secalis TaxID=38038 RepID=A0A1E1MIR8_RHYSE|nr:uncharacterized protein RSE6_09767 [Rhynchosporium secalis]
MKFISLSIVLVVLLILTLTSALGSGLEQRQGQVINSAPTVEECANSLDCLSAAAWWSDCQRAHVIGQPFDPSSNVRSCLCPPGRAIPSHVDWSSKLHNCIFCVEKATGKQAADTPLSLQIEQIIGSPSAKVGYCHGTLSTQELVKKTKDLARAKDFPLELPETILRLNSEKVTRIVTTKNLSDSIHSNIDSAQSGFTQTEQSSTLTAVFSTQFSTFEAVPMETFLASIATAIPTAVPDKQFSTFEAVPMESFLASIATAIPTAVPDNQFSTFEAIPVSSFLASFATAIPLPPPSFSDSSENPRGKIVPYPSGTIVKTCLHDNCLRQAIRSEPAVAGFCAAYTKSLKSAPSGIPNPLPACDDSPARMSSACSCLASRTSLSTSASSTSAQISTIKAPNPAMTAQTSTAPKLQSLMSSSAAPTSTLRSNLGRLRWASLPASSEVSDCRRSTECLRASNIFSTCAAEEHKLGGNVKSCFCTTNQASWTSSLSICAACIAKSLPDSPPSTAPAGRDLMVQVVDMTASIYCEPDSQGSLERLKKAGWIITAYLQSPVMLFDMSMEDIQ